MPPRLLRWAEYHRMPWKNGSGSTREVAAAPVGAPLPDFDWRVSIADVGAEGPFSAFPGVDRVLTLIGGPGITLAVDGTEHRLAAHAPFAFSGDSAVSCRLPGGPTRNVNVMTRRGRATASVRIVDVLDGRDGTAARGETLLALVLSGRLSLRGGKAGRTALERLDTVRQDGPGGLALQGHGTVAEIRITRQV